MSLEKQPTIFYMDDDADDLQFLRDAFHSFDNRCEVLTAENGEDGFKELLRLKSEQNLPSLIVLDINMPRMDGRQTFQHICEDEILCQIPVAIFSTSATPRDKAFFQGKNVQYMIKPVTFSLFKEVAGILLAYCGVHHFAA
jgi:CheY-like chemotaxis protein